MKRLLSSIYLCTLLSAALAGCSPAVPGPGDTTPPAELVTTAEATLAPNYTPTVGPTPTNTPVYPPDIDLDGVQIQFWHAWSGNLAQKLADLGGEFNATNEWGVLVDIRPFASPRDLSTAVTQGLQGDGDIPAAVVASIETAQTWTGTQPVVLDLNPLLHDPQWGWSAAELADFWPAAWEREGIAGQQLGIPARLEAPLLVYNQTWAAELGFTNSPTTPAEFRQQSCAAGQALLEDRYWDNNGMGGWLIETSPLTTASWLVAFDAPLQPEAAAGTFRFAGAPGLDAFRYLHSLHVDSCAWVARSYDQSTYFARRQALFITLSPEDLPGLQRILSHQGSSDQWQVLPFPGNSGEPVVLLGGEGYRILSGEPSDELAAWLFIRWLNQPLNLAQLAESGLGVPSRASAAEQVGGAVGALPGWQQAVELLGSGRGTPNLPGWAIARQVLADAHRQLYLADITVETIPAILEQVDQTILEVEQETQP